MYGNTPPVITKSMTWGIYFVSLLALLALLAIPGYFTYNAIDNSMKQWCFLGYEQHTERVRNWEGKIIDHKPYTMDVYLSTNRGEVDRRDSTEGHRRSIGNYSREPECTTNNIQSFYQNALKRGNIRTAEWYQDTYGVYWNNKGEYQPNRLNVD